jgi:c-di-GMP-binding flagellar brake protein YcgR
MEGSRTFKERRRSPRRAMRLVLEYCETYNSRYGGVVSNLSETGVLILSTEYLPIGRKINFKIFFCNRYHLDSFKGATRVVWKQFESEGTSRGYEYGLEFVHLSQEDQRKLLELLNKLSQSKDPCRYLLAPCHSFYLSRSPRSIL